MSGRIKGNVCAWATMLFALAVATAGVEPALSDPTPEGEIAPFGVVDPGPEPDTQGGDPFGDFLKSSSTEVVRTGPSCSFVRIQLPPGVSADEIPGM